MYLGSLGRKIKRNHYYYHNLSRDISTKLLVQTKERAPFLCLTKIYSSIVTNISYIY